MSLVIQIDKNKPTPIYWQIVKQIKRRIAEGSLQAGAILPSERQLAKELDVHRNTVIKAFSELKHQGFLQSKQGRGYRVSPHIKDNYASKTHFSDEKNVGDLIMKEGRWKGSGNLPSHGDGGRPVNWIHSIKDPFLDLGNRFDDIFQDFSSAGKISMAAGIPLSLYSKKEIIADIEDIFKRDVSSSYYFSPYRGDLQLRRSIQSFLKLKGIDASLSQIQILSESNQAIDFIISTLLVPGDKVIVEEPISPDVHRALALAGCKAITVPIDDEGIICENIETIIEQSKPRFIYVNSSYQDPTGICLSNRRRSMLIEISERYGIPIIEDDAASELGFEGNMPVTIKSMDRGNNVIYIYSFALTFIPGMSMAFVVAAPVLIKALEKLVSLRLMSLEWMSQKLIARALEDGRYIQKTREEAIQNKRKMQVVIDALDEMKELGVTYIKPKGGVYLWCNLPSHIDGRVFTERAYLRGLAITPGYLFYPKNSGGKNQVRIAFAYEDDENLKRGMEIFKVVLEHMCKKDVNNTRNNQ